ncbi:nucleolar protein 8-like [Mytilus californianus]|uniref:nucleolar protein 8-like n=1 Tax=Mytilus californianus TaxID=6549 RepID=UPI0022450014|nr:nucleolar protein 8-like [Mytilus californianus]XP_052061674.1 nucleolar protein 8-like [Mytilus californianus]
MSDAKRIFVGGLSQEIKEEELTERFQRFCEVLNVQIKKKKVDDAPDKIFAYVNVKSTPENLQKCISLYDKTKWKGSELRLQLAKENFLTRLENERKNGFTVEEKKNFKQDTIEHHNPYENLPDPSIAEMRGCVPGTKVPGEKNWVVGKYGRVLPVVYIRNKDKKKVVKVDPSKFCHNVKRMKEEETTSVSTKKHLTLEIEDVDSEIVRKRKGEFPEWTSKPNKQKKYDFEALKEKYLNNKTDIRSENLNKEPDFEVVSKDTVVSRLGQTFDSDNSDSDSYYKSLKDSRSKSFSKTYLSESSDGYNSDVSSDESVSCSGDVDLDVSDSKTKQNGKISQKDNMENIDVTKFRFSNYNELTSNYVQEKKSKPKIQPFKGTKRLYEKTESDTCKGTNRLESNPAKAFDTKITPNVKISPCHNTRDNFESKKEDLLIQKNKSNKTERSVTPLVLKDMKKKSQKPPSQIFPHGDDDGNVSASSADTDEIINKSKCMSPIEDTDRMFNNIFEFSPLLSSKGKNSGKIDGSTVGEYSSGLIKGEIHENENSSENFSTDDSDESDFEKFALKQSQKAKEMNKKEPAKQAPLVKKNEIENSSQKTDKVLENCKLNVKSRIERKSDMNEDEAKDDDSFINFQNDLTSKPLKGKNIQNEKLSKSLVNNDDKLKEKTSETQNFSSKSTTKEKKPNKDTNEKRLESLKQKQKETLAKKSAIQNALANIDASTRSNKKIIFDDSDSDSDSNSDSTASQVIESKDEEEDSTDDSDVDEAVNSKTLEKKNVPALFDNSESESTDSENDEKMFKIRPEFEGKSGQKRMELQSRYGNDDRFKLGERFIDSEEENMEEDIEEPTEEDERAKSLKILEQVMGTKIKPERKGKLFRDVSALHFDPSREDHTHYEVQAESQPKKEKKSSKKRKDTEVTENEEKEEDLPEVSKEKFFAVSDSLKDAFKPSSKDSDEPKGFSLLSAFGSGPSKEHDYEHDENEEDSGMETLQHKSSLFPWEQQFDDESSDSDRNDGNDNSDDSQSDEDMKEKEPIVFSSAKSFFFFQENDERISEGIKKFGRQDDLEIVKEKWLQKRPDLVEAYRTKHKRLLRKKKMEGKHGHKKVDVHKKHAVLKNR